MEPDEARIELVEDDGPSDPDWTSPFPPLDGPLSIGGADFGHFEGFPWEHAVAERLFSVDGRTSRSGSISRRSRLAIGAWTK